MGKRLFYKRFFWRMKRYGMFKALVCSGSDEFTFPFLPERYLLFKRISFILLLVIFSYLFAYPPVVTGPGPVELKGEFRIDEGVDQFGLTRLHRAVIHGKENIVKILFRNGADPNSTDKYGWSSLHWARFLGRDDISEILIGAGADRNIRATSGWFVFRKGSLPEDLRSRR